MIKVYYGFYGTALTLAFLVLPLNFFFHATAPLADDEDDQDHDEVVETCGKKLCRALKYTSASLTLFAALVVLGIFLPFEGSSSSSSITDKLDFVLANVQANRGQDLFVFLVNVVSVVGMLLLIVYTGYGMSVLPCGLINDRSTVDSERESVDSEIADLEGQLEAVRGDASSLTVQRLERDLRLLQRTRRELEQSSRSCVNTCLRLLRPFQMIVGVMFGLLGLLIWISLLLTSIDKAMHSDGAKSGYVLKNGTLPNPVDMALVYAQEVFPLDYLLYVGMVLFFVFSSMAGVKAVGIRFLWLPIYRIRAYATRPQALSLMALTLIFILLAVNVLLFSVVPDYTTYGSQNYAVDNSTKVMHCDDTHAPVDECNMTRIAVILLAFHSKAWIFGAAYFWLVWIFLLVILLGSFMAMYKCKRPSRRSRNEDEDGLLDDEDSLAAPPPPPPRTS